MSFCCKYKLKSANMHLLLTNSHIISRSQSTQFIDIKKYKNDVLKSDTIGLQNEYKNATILGNVDEMKVLLSR